jgi:hypothetical protein
MPASRASAATGFQWRQSGRIAWQTRLPRPVIGSLEGGGVHGGLAAGEGVLVVPAYGQLVASR